MAEATQKPDGGPEQAVPGGWSWTDVAFVALLAALVWTAYWPSLGHGPRADQWHYLVDTVDRHDLLDLIRHTYSYNRTRSHGLGDGELFRPLLFVTLAAEKALFGTNLWMPQAVGIFLHCGVTALLLLLLKRVAALAPGGSVGRPPLSVAGLLPYAVVAFFALNSAVVELVIFAHLHGYLLFLVFLLGSLVLLLGGPAARPGRGGAALWGAWALACLSAFTYEMGQFYAVLAGLFVAAAHSRRLGARRALALFAAFASILPLYQAVNRLDRLAHRGQFTEEATGQVMLGQAFTTDSLRNAGRFTLYTAFQPFVPSADKDAYVRDRLDVPEWAWNGDGPGVGPALLASLALVPAVALGLAGVWRLARRGRATLWGAFLLLCCLYAVYAGMNVVGRMNLRREPDILSRNSYYAYPALLLALAAGFTAWQAPGRAGRAGTLGRGSLLLGLAVLSAADGFQVRRVNEMLAGAHRPVRMTTGALNHFVARHRGEPDFSLGIDHAASDQEDSYDGLSVTTILFGRWMTSPEPKYVLVLRGGRVAACRRGATGGPRPRLAPEQEVAPELKVVGGAPAEDAQLALAAEAAGLVAGDLRHAQPPPGGAGGQQRLPANAAAEQRLGGAVPAILVEFQLADEARPVGAVDDHHVRVAAAVQQVDRSGKEPIAEARHQVVVGTAGRRLVARDDDHVVALVHLGGERGDQFGDAVAVRAERHDHVAPDEREDLPVAVAEARFPLHVNLEAVLPRPLGGAVAGAAVEDQNLIDPLRPHARHNRRQAHDFVQDGHEQRDGAPLRSSQRGGRRCAGSCRGGGWGKAVLFVHALLPRDRSLDSGWP
jgi:hypothetical protein